MSALIYVLAALVFAVLRLGTKQSAVRSVMTVLVGVLAGLALWSLRQPVIVSVTYR